MCLRTRHCDQPKPVNKEPPLPGAHGLHSNVRLVFSSTPRFTFFIGFRGVMILRQLLKWWLSMSTPGTGPASDCDERRVATCETWTTDWDMTGTAWMLIEKTRECEHHVGEPGDCQDRHLEGF